MPNPLRKNYEQVVSIGEPVIIPEHVNDWHHCKSIYPFKIIMRDMPEEKRIGFNMQAALTSPESIRYRQRDHDWEGGRRGDYLLMDAGGGRMTVPFQIFKRLF